MMTPTYSPDTWKDDYIELQRRLIESWKKDGRQTMAVLNAEKDLLLFEDELPWNVEG